MELDPEQQQQKVNVRRQDSREETTPPGQADDVKKPRACEACRGLKVRCEAGGPDGEDDAPCKRCLKAGRACVVTVPTRKRQKKTDSRVSELEKKIDALTASLQARAADVPTTATTTTTTTTATAHMSSPEAVGHKRKEPHGAAECDGGGGGLCRHVRGDVVDRGIVTMERAEALFARYNEGMAPHLPGVVFPPETGAAEVRESRPMLFLAVMAAAAGESYALQSTLQHELMQVLAEKVFLTGEKTLELVQALLVASIWYMPPERVEQLKVYQLIHLAAVTAIDIGLGRPAASSALPMPMPVPGRPARAPAVDPQSAEARRTWLTCFFMAMNTSMTMRRPNLIRWTPFMAESMDVLASGSGSAASSPASDRYLCHLIWSHRLADQVGLHLSPDEVPRVADMSDARTQYALRALEQDLNKYVAAVPPALMSPLLRIGFCFVSLYMHETALHADTAEHWRAALTADALEQQTSSSSSLVGTEPLSPAHVAALSACLAASEAIFAAFLASDLPAIRCMPVYNFMRVAYAVVVLIKLYFAAARNPNHLGRVIDKHAVRVTHYLDALIAKFRAAAHGDSCRAAARFHVVMLMFRSWFLKQQVPDDDGDDVHQPREIESFSQPAPLFYPPASGPSPSASSSAAAAAAPGDQGLFAAPWITSPLDDIGLGVPLSAPDPIDFGEESARVCMDDAWFSAAVGGMPDPNLLLFR